MFIQIIEKTIWIRNKSQSWVEVCLYNLSLALFYPILSLFIILLDYSWKISFRTINLIIFSYFSIPIQTIFIPFPPLFVLKVTDKFFSLHNVVVQIHARILRWAVLRRTNIWALLKALLFALNLPNSNTFNSLFELFLRYFVLEILAAPALH